MPKIQTYQPEIQEVDKSDIYAAINALGIGIEYTEELLDYRKTTFGRKRRTDRLIDARLTEDINKMKNALAKLKFPIKIYEVN